MASSESNEIDEHLHLPRGDILKLVAVGVIQSISVISNVLILRRLVDALNLGAPISQTIRLGLVYIIVGSVLAATRGIEYALSERVGYRLVAKLRMFLFGHLLDLPSRIVQRTSQGAVLLRFTGDLSTYRTWISRGLSRGIVASLTLMGSLGVLIAIDWVIGLSIATMLLFGMAGSALGGYQVKRTTRAVRWRRSLLTSNVAEQIRSLAVVQAFGRARGETQRLANQNQDMLRAQYRAARARGILRLLASFSGTLSVGATIIVGAFELANGSITIGGIVAAMAACRFLTSPVRTIGFSHEYWQAAQVSKRKLKDFLARPKREGVDEGLVPLRPKKGRLELRGVSVRGALNDVNLVIQPGELFVIMGDNGAGKSTLLSTVARSAELSAGEIFVDEQALSQSNLRSIARNIGIVSPDLPLMRGTILRNITYRYAGATSDMIDRVILDCRIDEVLAEIEGDLSTWLTEGGGNLSMGHRQRIMLARAILGRPRLLLLDEPTANLDAVSSEVIRRAMSNYRGTIVLVTHDRVEAELADHVCFMQGGRVRRVITGAEYRAEAANMLRIAKGHLRW